MSPNSFFLMLVFTFYFLPTGKAQLDYNSCNCGCNCDPQFFRIQHFHKIENHVYFGKNLLVDQVCTSTESIGEIHVSADGSASTILEIEREHCNGGSGANPFTLIQMDEAFEEIGNADQDNYGIMEKLNHSGNTSTFKYTHPKNGPESGTLSKEIFVKFSNQLGDIFGFMIIHVHRSPIIMVHGLWGDDSAFNSMRDQLIASGDYETHQILKVNYQNSNDRYFLLNANVVPTAIRDIFYDCIAQHLNAGKVNVVCHSMGGMLTRQYMASTPFSQNQDINRVITCNTPHGGSQMANFLLDPSQYGPVIANLLGFAGMNCYNGAVQDLRVGSSATNGINNSMPQGDVKVHTISTSQDAVAQGSSLLLPTVASFSGILMYLTINYCGSSFFTDLFNSDANDVIVANTSQRGGLNFGFNNTHYNDQQHVGSVSNSSVINRTRDLLNYNETIASTIFSNQFNPITTLSYSLNVPCLPFSDERDKNDRNVPAIEILSPSPNDTLMAGDTLEITYTYQNVDSILGILFYNTDSLVYYLQDTTGHSFYIPIPANTYGKHAAVLIGLDQNHHIVAMDSVSLCFGTNAILDSIKIVPDDFYLNQGDTASFSVLGFYNDGNIRNLTQDEDLIYDFALGHASIYENNQIRLDSLAGDTLLVTKDTISSTPVIVHKIGSNFPPGCTHVTSLSSSGPGTLIEAINCATYNDTITFDASIAGDTIDLQSMALSMENNVFVINSNAQKVYVLSSNTDLLNLFSSGNYYFENLHFISNNISNRVVNNYGHVTFKNVTFSTLTNSDAVIFNTQDGLIKFEGVTNQY